ncbi:hypothetical protein PG616_01005 [Riemerella anatipestifer]|nr:hypothetical protein [Riemerella anatipestifer]
MHAQTLAFEQKLSLIKRNIRKQIRLNRLTSACVCKRLGKNRNYLSQMQNPTLSKLIDISSAIGCRLEDIVCGV